MLLLFRFLLAMLRGGFRSPIGPLEESVIRFTVLPHDCDLNFHLNAGRFVSFMDIGRAELIARVRILGPMLRRGWRPVAGGLLIRYRRSILPFERFDVRSRVLGWDAKWIYLEQIVEKNGLLCAIGHVRTVIKTKARVVPPAEVLALTSLNIESPVLPDFVARWRDAEDAR